MPYERRRPLTDPLAAVRSMIWHRVIQSKDVKMIISCLPDVSSRFTQPVLPYVPVSVHPYARPNRIICNAAISACEKGSQWEIASSLLGGMAEQQVLPDCISYTGVISCCHKNSLWIAALCLLSEMQGVSISADTIAYNAAISASARAGVWDAVFWICCVGDFLDFPIAYSNQNWKSSESMFHVSPFIRTLLAQIQGFWFVS